MGLKNKKPLSVFKSPGVYTREIDYYTPIYNDYISELIDVLGEEYGINHFEFTEMTQEQRKATIREIKIKKLLNDE
jgi:hypothetical protein